MTTRAGGADDVSDNSKPPGPRCVVCFAPRGDSSHGLVCAKCAGDGREPDRDERDPMLDDYEIFHE